jgi:hypothetical protein
MYVPDAALADGTRTLVHTIDMLIPARMTVTFLALMGRTISKQR